MIGKHNSYIRFYPILDFTVFKLPFSFTVVYFNSICKCTLMGRNNVLPCIIVVIGTLREYQTEEL
jgi:hypothetical protein